MSTKYSKVSNFTGMGIDPSGTVDEGQFMKFVQYMSLLDSDVKKLFFAPPHKMVSDGTYTVGAKLTGGGQNGTITISDGIITAIQQAT